MTTDQHAAHRDRKRERLQQKRAHGPGPLAASQRKKPKVRWGRHTFEQVTK